MSSPMVAAAIWWRSENTLLYAIEVTILSALFAVPIAWAVSRTDMPGKGLIRVLVLGRLRHAPPISVPSPGFCWLGPMQDG